MGDYFRTIGYQAVAGFREGHKADCEASVILMIGGSQVHTASGGAGPINALDNALRKALEGDYPEVTQFHLADYAVSAIDESMGTATPVKVVVRMRDDFDREEWETTSINQNIIEASWQALVDSIEHGLQKHRPQPED